MEVAKMTEPNTVWYNIKKTDPYFINNRVRRFTNTGLILSMTTIETQIPLSVTKVKQPFFPVHLLSCK